MLSRKSNSRQYLGSDLCSTLHDLGIVLELLLRTLVGCLSLLIPRDYLMFLRVASTASR